MHSLTHAGAWKPNGTPPWFDRAGLLKGIGEVRRPLFVVRDGSDGVLGIANTGDPLPGQMATAEGSYPLMASLPALYPEWLGDRSFLETHGVRFPYIVGAMANGIATPEMVIAMAQAGMLAFFGAGGLGIDRVAAAVDQIQAAVSPGMVWGSNLIHSPHEPALEDAVCDLYLARGVRRVSASAYMRLTPAVVRYAFSGVHTDPEGRIVRPNHLFAKISRSEVAGHFMSPPPEKIVAALVEGGKLTASEAALAARLPVAEEITVESDSGGHTDNRPLGALLPTVMGLRDELCARFEYQRPIRVGAAGGIGTPAAAAAAFSMGAAYVLTGSINAAAVEAGMSPQAKELLADAGVADQVMAPSPDMFEMGVKVQVLKRGTFFAARAQKLFGLYQQYQAWDDIPEATRQKVEQDIFQKSFDDVWADTERFWSERSAEVAHKAATDPRKRMALVFRWYVGLSSHWAIAGTPERRLDYQVWCGPAMGAFNAWVKGTFLQDLENRSVVQMARNLMEGAAVVTRAQQLRTYGVPVPREAFDFRPRRLLDGVQQSRGGAREGARPGRG